MSLEKLKADETLTVQKSFRHILVFQFKLFTDAIRDLVFSPISIVGFFIDMATQPKVKDSVSYKLMMAGRRSDRIINLFDEYHDSSDYTIDETVVDVEKIVYKQLNKDRGDSDS